MRVIATMALVCALLVPAFSAYAGDSRKPYYNHGAYRAMPYRATGGGVARANRSFKDDRKSAKRVEWSRKDLRYQ